MSQKMIFFLQVVFKIKCIWQQNMFQVQGQNSMHPAAQHLPFQQFLSYQSCQYLSSAMQITQEDEFYQSHSIEFKNYFKMQQTMSLTKPCAQLWKGTNKLCIYCRQPLNCHGQPNQQSFAETLKQQNESACLPKDNSPSPNQMKQINNQLSTKDTDFSYFWQLWSHPQHKKFIQGIQFLVEPQNWPLLRFHLESVFELFLNIYENKLSKVSFLAELYPGLPQLVKKIAATVEGSPNKYKTNCEQRNSTALYEHYLQEIDSKSKQEGAFYIKDESGDFKNNKIPIGDFIAHSPLFNGSYAWADIFNRATCHKRLQIQSKPFEVPELEAERRKGKENREALREKILAGESVLSAEDYPCCAQFFYFNFRTYDKIISNMPLITERRFSDLWETPEGAPSQLTKTALDICGLLNSGGGVILFNTFRSYLEVWPKGQIMEEAKFKLARDLIAEQLRNIRPEVHMDEHVFVSFVPLVRNPIIDGLPPKGRNYIQGLFVMRIVVRPPEQHCQQVYFYSKQPSLPFQVAIVEGNTTKVLLRSQLTKYIKRRFHHYYVPQTDYNDPIELFMLQKTYSIFSNHGPCVAPEKGLMLSQKTIKGKGVQGENLEQKYKYLTLLVAAKSNHQAIKQRLQAKGIDCEIVVKYAAYRFKAANNSAALFHNTRFDLLLNEVAYKKDFQFGGRYILTILVTPFIKLTERNKGNLLPEEDFTTLQGWLHTEHPNQSLTLWRYEEEKDTYEFFLQTTSKLATLFMYYVLNHYGEKCSLKNPKNYERMSQEEKRTRMKLFYPRDRTQSR